MIYLICLRCGRLIGTHLFLGVMGTSAARHCQTSNGITIGMHYIQYICTQNIFRDFSCYYSQKHNIRKKKAPTFSASSSSAPSGMYSSHKLHACPTPSAPPTPDPGLDKQSLCASKRFPSALTALSVASSRPSLRASVRAAHIMQYGNP